MLSQRNFNADRQLHEYDIVNEQYTVIGMAQLRLVPSKSQEMPAGFESHIYYEINPEYRNQGYATTALQDILEQAKIHKMSGLIATVNSDNVASVRVIEKNGGKFIEQGITSTGKTVLKYKLAC